MIIKKFALGNAGEAFIEDRLIDGFNIIFSDDNNKGKTIVMQSMLYAIGNEPVFPSSFDYKNYYHYVELELDNGESVILCRKGNSYVMKSKEGIRPIDSVAELKVYLTRIGLSFPIIIKDNLPRAVDPVLLYQIFFVGQDKKDSSGIFNSGFYKKEDFFNLVYVLAGLDKYEPSSFDDDDVKSRIFSLTEEKNVLLKQIKILKKNYPSMKVISQKIGNDAFKEKIQKIETINKDITELKKSRNRALQRKTINERTLSEIRALNKSNSSGNLYCLDCGSGRIGYSSGDRSYIFDISDSVMRKNIHDAIQDKICLYQQIIEECTFQINILQRQMQKLLEDDEIDLEAIFLYKKDITSVADADTRLVEIESELDLLNNQKNFNKQKKLEDTQNKERLRQHIIEKMNFFYKSVDPLGNLVFDDLFSKRSSIYSGCEATEFYLSKLYSLAVVLNHRFPIMMDYFRDGELSTEKEKTVLQLFNELNNQIIFTATLKKEELGKYSGCDEINAIDYSLNDVSHILSERYVSEFKQLLTPLMIKF